MRHLRRRMGDKNGAQGVENTRLEGHYATTVETGAGGTSARGH